MKKVNIFIIILGVISFYSCNSQKTTSTSGTAEKAEQMRIAIIDYMECEECTEGELQKLVSFGSAVVGSLTAILREGPSDAKKETLTEHLRKSYSDLVKYQETHPDNKVTLKEDEYIRTYMDNYIALYQSRAVIALSTIGGPEAKKALESTSDLTLRADVRALLQERLKSM
jgi:hypothetical protein